MSTVDWAIVGVFVVGIVGVGLACRRYMRSVADWLVAGRGVGRYLGIVADTGQATGIITVVAWMQSTYVAGPGYWWYLILTFPLGLILAVTGWAIYRLRETKVLTINELIERRYSRKLRIFSGFLCFASGAINMGIFPIVAGRFVVYFCGLPQSFDLLGMSMATVPAITAVLVFVAVLFCFLGGHVSVVITDFIQSSIMMLMYVAIGFLVYRVVTWDHVAAVYRAQENMGTFVNPLTFSPNSEFNIVFYITIAFTLFYNLIVWQPDIVRGQSALDPHEAKMMMLWSYLKVPVGVGLLCFAGVACFAFMNLPVFSAQAEGIRESLSSITNVQVRDQMVVPAFLATLMPAGIMGLFVVAMIAAFISTNDTYIMSWAGVFVQDVVLPLRKKPLSQKQHIWLLRGAVIGLAVFVYLFSILYTETEYIIMFMLITFAIYTSGAGVVILGALYWRRGTTAGGWAAMIAGAGIPSCAMVLGQIWQKVPFLMQYAEKFPLNGAEIALLTNIFCIAIYIVVSLLTTNWSKKFDLDGLLNRKGGAGGEVMVLRRPGTGNRLTRHLHQILWAAAILLTGAMVVATWYNVTHDVAAESWLSFWKYWLFIMFFCSIPVTLWLIGGGTRDVVRLVRHLRAERVDESDDGYIRDKSQSSKP